MAEDLNPSASDPSGTPATGMPEEERDCCHDEGTHRFRDGESICICGEVEYTATGTPDQHTIDLLIDSCGRRGDWDTGRDADMAAAIGKVLNSLAASSSGATGTCGHSVADRMTDASVECCLPAGHSGSNDYSTDTPTGTPDQGRQKEVEAALRAICDDAVGERRDPLWIVQRNCILRGFRALAASSSRGSRS